jgi:hypothetical protein
MNFVENWFKIEICWQGDYWHCLSKLYMVFYLIQLNMSLLFNLPSFFSHPSYWNFFLICFILKENFLFCFPNYSSTCSPYFLQSTNMSYITQVKIVVHISLSRFFFQVALHEPADMEHWFWVLTLNNLINLSWKMFFKML